MPMPESWRICLLLPASMSLLMKSMSFRFRRSLLPLDAGVNVFGVLAEDDDVHRSGCFTGDGTPCNTSPGARRHTGPESGAAPHSDERMPPPTGVVSGPLIPTRNSRSASTVSSGSQLSNLCLGFFAGENFVPGDPPLAAIGLLHRRIEHAD